MNCPMCQKEMHAFPSYCYPVDTYFASSEKDAFVCMNDKISYTTNDDAWSYWGKKYSLKQFEQILKLKAFW